MRTDDPAVPVRQAVRRFSSGVAVLTVRHGDVRHGTTISSLTAVSRQPLLVAVCLARGSGFVDLAVASGSFTVNVLGAHQADLAAWFADPGRPAGTAQFDHLRWQPDPATGAPLLDNVLAGFSCTLLHRIPAGDHYLLLAEVTAGRSAEGNPLLHFAGRLHDGELRGLPRPRTATAPIR